VLALELPLVESAALVVAVDRTSAQSSLWEEANRSSVDTSEDLDELDETFYERRIDLVLKKTMIWLDKTLSH